MQQHFHAVGDLQLELHAGVCSAQGLNGAAVATINILGYTAMAGIVGAGGLGEIAIRYGLYRFQPSIMWITIVLLVILVQIFQEIGIKVVNKYDNRIN